MENVVQYLLQSPLLAALGALLVLAIVFAPLILSVAGLTGQQIIDLLQLSMQFIVNLVRAFREENKS